MNFQRKPGTVFVTVPEPTPTVPSPESYERSWEKIAQQLAFETTTSPIPESVSEVSSQPEGCVDDLCSPTLPEPEKATPSIDEIFAESLPLFIEASRWGRYIFPGPASRILDNTIFKYHNPCPNFWDLYELSKGIFRDLGIRVSKERGTWVAHIPIKCFTDKVFIDSGLAASEKTLLVHTGIDPVKILNEIRQRQFQETRSGNRASVRESGVERKGIPSNLQVRGDHLTLNRTEGNGVAHRQRNEQHPRFPVDGYRNVKLRQRGTVGEVIGDAVGSIAIFVGGYLAFIVGGL